MRNLVVIFLLMIPCWANATNGWTTVYSANGNFQFEFPAQPQTFDTDSTLLLALGDTINDIGYQAFVISSIDLSMIDPNLGGISNSQLFSLLAQTSIYYQGAQLESFVDTQLNNNTQISGKEIGLSFPVGDSRYFIFLQAYVVQGKLYLFSISGMQENLGLLLQNKTLLFQSINIYA